MQNYQITCGFEFGLGIQAEAAFGWKVNGPANARSMESTVQAHTAEPWMLLLWIQDETRE